MCGFVGLFYKKAQELLELGPFLNIISHRGPDSRGFFVDREQRMNIGFSRLSIIDLQTGEQPVYNEDKQVVAVINGEVYNYEDITRTLKGKGHIFHSIGDSETVVHLYEEYGESFLEHIEGMFAIALWDVAKGMLILARDRLGIKPLYYHNNYNKIAFSSEVKPLLNFPEMPREIDEDGLVEYLSYGYTLAPDTIFKDIKKLRPGHMLLITREAVTETKYWDCAEPGIWKGSVDELKEELLHSFDESVRLHLRSDVPVGAFLSGGIDSGLLVARASHFHPRLKTYTLRFEESTLDESKLAGEVARRYDTEHTTFTVKPSQLTDSLSQMVWFCDEPLADSGLLPNFVICRLAAQDGVKVVLSGAGGDELFAGYNYYFPSSREKYLLKMPGLVKKLSSIITVINPELARKLNRAAAYDSDRIEHYMGHVMVCSPIEMTQLLNYPYKADSIRRNYFRSFNGDTLNAKLYTDIKTYLTDDLMLLADRTTMAHSLEGRVPYLHHPFVEKTLEVSDYIKAPENKQKWLLKEISRPYLPESLFEMPKSGFNSPINQWASGSTGEMMMKTLRSRRFLERPWWNKNFIQKFVQGENLKGRNCHIFFTLFMLEIFCRIHIDNRYSSPPSSSLKNL
ncbi:MAG: asparagine synthase (glutamine-hydrolyzing) [Vulcanimicrobiota bacterium]